uniref:Uncharacterized protein n=1 Tax=Chinchilla lanigera TaxID=34839 RepID=A0A8C2VDN7_CHILA
MDNCGDGSDQGSWPPASCRGPGLHAAALASLLLLASAGLLVGLLWCCCSSGWAARQPGARDLCLRYGAVCNICYPCPGRVAPGELRGQGPAFQDQGGLRE